MIINLTESQRKIIYKALWDYDCVKNKETEIEDEIRGLADFFDKSVFEGNSEQLINNISNSIWNLGDKVTSYSHNKLDELIKRVIEL